MDKIALTLPGGQTIDNPAGLQITSLGGLLSGILSIALYIAIFLAFYWLIWAGYQYILSSGKKEDLAKARSKITWALIGLVVIFAAYFIAKFASEIFPTQFGKGGLPF